MSSDNTENISVGDAIKKLSELDEGDQIKLVNEIFDERKRTIENQFFYVIIYEISYLRERHNEIEVIEKLVKSGMYRNIIVIILDKLRQLPPSVQADARVLESIPDDKFINLIMMLDKNNFTSKTIDQLSTEHNIDRGTLGSSFRFLRNIATRNFQGNLALDEISPQLTELGISSKKIELIKQNIVDNSENLRKIMVFNAVMDGILSLKKLDNRLNDLEARMGKIWDAITELTAQLRGDSNPNTSNPGIH